MCLYVYRWIHRTEKVCSLDCKSLTTNYELTMRNALATLFPHIRLFTCWFHYSQALKRKVKQIPHFDRFLRGNEAAEEIYYKLQCLPLLPSHHILDAFQQLKQDALAVDKKKFGPFLKYFERQWIQKVHFFIYLWHISTFFIATNVYYCIFTEGSRKNIGF